MKECPCILITIVIDGNAGDINTSSSNYYNGRLYYQFSIGVYNFVIYWDGAQWLLVDDGLGGSNQFAYIEGDVLCPTGPWSFPIGSPVESLEIVEIECRPCDPIQERHKETFPSVKLPSITIEDDRGFVMCCDPLLVLADYTSSDSWKNDVSSAWIKLSSGSDSASFSLVQNGTIIESLGAIDVVNETNAFYTTVYWQDVLNDHGPGCYEIAIDYSIAGITGSLTWAKYTLKEYTIHNALETARLRVIFDSYHEIEGIDFTASQVEDSIRFNGFIGNRQPNTEIDNLIYSNREMKKVIRENLNTWEIKTDPLNEGFITKITDLYLLSENDLFISDYNAHNHSYFINDIPVIVQESAEISYFDYARRASLTCIVGDKFKNKRSYYNG